MKKFITTFFAFSLCLSTYAQLIVPDSVYIGAGYTKQVYYSLSNDSVGEALISSWDLGFITSVEDASIIVNHAKGVFVYETPDTNWAARTDTLGLFGWPKLYNGDQSWSSGAFSITRSPTDIYDFGWGTFHLEPGPDQYNIVGDDSIYVLQTPTGLKKIRLISKLGIPNSYIFRIANLDGTMDKTVTISAAPYVATKNFIYYNIDNDATVDIEPNKSAWDLLLTPYRTVPDNPGPPKAGVLSNAGVKVAKASKVDIAAVDYANYSGSLSSSLTAIGSNWKVFTGTYTIVDSLAYFIKTTDNKVFKLWFTGFGGFANGKMAFNKEEILLTGISAMNNSAIKAAICPNPSDGDLKIIFSTNKSTDAEISVFDLSGRKVLNFKSPVNDGVNIIPVTMNGISSGSYLVKVIQDGGMVNLKMTVTK